MVFGEKVTQPDRRSLRRVRRSDDVGEHHCRANTLGHLGCLLAATNRSISSAISGERKMPNYSAPETRIVRAFGSRAATSIISASITDR